jgi:GNAT superfamily N-acetyltransferase
MYWRLERHGKAWRAAKGEPNRQAFMRLIVKGEVCGILAFDGTVPVGWCCVGPKESFSRLKRAKKLQRDSAAETWAIVCLYLPPKYRRQGLGTRLIAAATELALRRGASEVEGYPLEPRPGKSIPGAFAWTGVVRQFESCGFRPCPGRGRDLRPIYLKT